ncbi:MAG: hypothetical protein ABI650_11745 [Dokdonella sp.]
MAQVAERLALAPATPHHVFWSFDASIARSAVLAAQEHPLVML